MVDDIKISVVMAVFNRVSVVEQALSSVAEQTYKNIELIVIDGGSTDGTVDIIKKYADAGKVAYWCSEPDNGIYDAFNKGVQHATGKYVQFLGSDDALCDEYSIEKIVEELLEDVDVLNASVWRVDEKYKLQSFFDSTKPVKDGYDYSMVPHQGMFAKKSLLIKYPFSAKYSIAADYLFFLTCLFDSGVRMRYTTKSVAFYATDGISNNNREQVYRENNEIRALFHLPPQLIVIKPPIREFIKLMLKKVGFFELVVYYCNRYWRKTWIPHSCNNKICRWCNRGV